MGGSAGQLNRRQLLTAGRPEQERPRPPGVTSATLDACTGCEACMAACPECILTLANGKVAVDFSGGECTFCSSCEDACPEPVFTGSRVMAHVAAISDSCFVHAGIACMTCRDACPQEAIRFLPRLGRPFQPLLAAQACTGCGACIAPCPAGAITTRKREAAHA
ncbi:MAG: ferredoxin-type protein NapF [Notoacmeibacter sp.]|nr:ferredoxin-type protein NapF [Notoacmeibacter sp.]